MATREKKYKNRIIVSMHGTKIHRICHLSPNDNGDHLHKMECKLQTTNCEM